MSAPQEPLSPSLADEIAIMVGRPGQTEHRLVQRLVALVERERKKVSDFYDFLADTGPEY